MLPKPDKTKKTSSPLNLVELTSPVDRLKSKRRWLIILLSVTIGLSLIFSFYRFFSGFQFSLPHLSPSPPSLDHQVFSLLGSEKNYWSVFFKTFPPDSRSLTWEYQSSLIFQNRQSTDFLTALTAATPSAGIISSRLPSGLPVQEIITTTSDFVEISTLVSLPQKKLLFIFRRQPFSDPDQVKKLAAIIAEKIYWAIAPSLN